MLKVDADWLESLGKPRIHEWTEREDEILLAGWKNGFKKKVSEYIGMSEGACERRYMILKGESK